MKRVQLPGRRRRERAPRVLLIGGASHTGKSTLARALAAQLGYRCQATDKLARHPGRPWRTPPEQVPPHIADHYLSLSVDALIADVLRHYRENVWPQVVSLVETTIGNTDPPGLVIEGSALWPEQAPALLSAEVAGLWLTAGDDLLRARIYRSSEYPTRSPRGRAMIDKFLARTCRYNARMMDAVRRLGLTSIEVTAASGVPALVQACIAAIMMG
jgi:2-phosphoglycerate kinase